MALSDIVSGAVRALIRPFGTTDVVAVTLFGGFVPIFPSARPLVATVYEEAKLMEHPLETGATIADHIVFQPVEIEIPFLCIGEASYRSTYALIRATFQMGALLTIRTRTGTYPNMVIAEMPHEESPEMFNGIAIRVRFREAKFVTPKTGLAPTQVKDPKQASTVSRGAQQTRTPSAPTAANVTTTAANSGQGAAPKGSTLYQWAYGS